MKPVTPRLDPPKRRAPEPCNCHLIGPWLLRFLGGAWCPCMCPVHVAPDAAALDEGRA